MKKVFIIVDDFCPAFAFTSKRMASKQMEVILNELQSGKWFIGEEANHDHAVTRIEKDEKGRVLRITYKRLSSGELSHYRLVEKELNSGYKIK